MSKTEQIIADYLKHDPDVFRDDNDLIAELRRLAKLQEAYWAEIKWCRANCETVRPNDMTQFDITKATDAARREAGEV